LGRCHSMMSSAVLSSHRYIDVEGGAFVDHSTLGMKHIVETLWHASVRMMLHRCRKKCGHTQMGTADVYVHARNLPGASQSISKYTQFQTFRNLLAVF